MSGDHTVFQEVEAFIAEARNGPECFKCHHSINDFDQVRVVTVRVEDKPLNVWMHANHVGEAS